MPGSFLRTSHAPKRRFLARAALALLAVVAALAGAQPAVGVDGPTTPAPGSTQRVESWALAPTGADQAQPGSRTSFTYTLAPGATVQDSATLWNFSTGPLTFRLYGADAFNNTQGAFTLLASNQPSRDVGSWVALATSSVTVPARTKVDIPFTLHVPQSASPGDHAAAILASASTPAIDVNHRQVLLDRRTGSRVYLRVTGAVKASLSLENLTSTYHGVFNPFDGSLDVHYTVRNTGNVRLGAHVQLVAHDLFGRSVATHKLPDLEELLPGNAVNFSAKLTGVPATFRVGATVSITPFAPQGVKDQLPARVEGTTHAWAIPWTLLLLVALAYLLWRIYRRWRDRTHPGPPGPRGEVPLGGPAGGPNGQRTANQRESVLRFQPGGRSAVGAS